jgi:DNA-directed RNA polymerase subunit beta
MAATIQTIQTNFRMRHSFGKIEHILEIPNLIDIQKRSYDKFLQTDVPRDDRENTGLQGVAGTRSKGRSTTSTSVGSVG